MKVQNLIPGKILSRDEMKSVKGGAPICSIGQIVVCHCSDQSQLCDFGDGVNSAITICNNDGACVGHGGVASGGCSSTCPGA